MNLEKAIEIVTQIDRFSNYPFMPGDKHALRMLIAAGIRLEAERDLNPIMRKYLLPKETEK